jgi:hypothetical protein
MRHGQIGRGAVERSDGLLMAVEIMEKVKETYEDGEEEQTMNDVLLQLSR